MEPNRFIDINCDMGEGSGAEPTETDRELMRLISSVNIACGAHAGSPELMETTARLAMQFGVAVGAHPGYADREHFGRRDLSLPDDEISRLITNQVKALAKICGELKIELVHIKPHGALYNQAAKEPVLAMAVAKAVNDFSHQIILVGLAGSKLVEAGLALGMSVANEGFPERTYESDGSLRKRSIPGALISDADIAATQGLRLAVEGITGQDGNTRVNTLCIHGDSPGAPGIALLLRQKLIESKFGIQSISFK